MKAANAMMLACSLLLASTASGQAATTVASGNVVGLFGDPDDFVVELDAAGSCGSKYFHTQRANKNFKEMVAVAMTAFSTGKKMTYFVVSCAGDRNITSHGFVLR